MTLQPTNEYTDDYTKDSYGKYVALIVVWLIAVIGLGIFSKSGSDAFVPALPVFYYILARWVNPYVRAAHAWALASFAAVVLVLVVGMAPETKRSAGSLNRSKQVSPTASTAPAGNVDIKAMMTTARTHAARKETALEQQTYEQVLAAIPYEPQASYYLAALHSRSGKQAEASRLLKGTIANLPENSLWRRRCVQLLESIEKPAQ